MKIHALSCVWGDYIDRFLKGTVKSLGFPSNKEAMKGVIWNIFSEEERFKEIDEAIAQVLPETEIRFRDLSMIRDRVDYLHCALIWQIKECIKQRSKMLLLPPDSIFGDETIKNFIEAGKAPGVCVFSAHPRVLPTVLMEEFQSNASLVKASWKHLHRSWTDAEEGSDRQNSFIGGVSWKRMADDLYSVKHLLPTPYFCDFTEADLHFFETAPGIGSIDHVWPSLLVQQGRIKYLASSDAAFVIELTDSDKNLPAVARGQDTSQFWQKHAHNIFFDQISAIFRGE